MSRMIGIVGRRVPDRHDGIADEFVDGAGMRHDLVRHRREVAGGGYCMTRAGSAFSVISVKFDDVGKQQRDFPARAHRV